MLPDRHRATARRGPALGGASASAFRLRGLASAEPGSCGTGLLWHHVRVDDFVIRQATDSDLLAAAGLRWTWVVDGKDAPPQTDSIDFIARFARWARESPMHICFIAESAGDVVGMAWLALNTRVPSPRSFDRQNGDVQSVYVLPSFRRRGVASALIAAISESARQRGIERLTVHSSEEAISTYARAGFESSELLRHLIVTE